jgi:cytochrome c oxidase subunit II
MDGINSFIFINEISRQSIHADIPNFKVTLTSKTFMLDNKRMKPDYGWFLPVNISSHGQPMDLLITILHVFMAIIFIGWFIFFVLCLIRFRERPGQSASKQISKTRLPGYLDVGIAAFEILLLFSLSIPIIQHVNEGFPDPKSSVRIRILAEQFAWNIHYAGPDGVFGRTATEYLSGDNPVGLVPDDQNGADDFVSINEMHVPVNQPVTVRLSTKDVIHSFAIPVMRIKQDVIPGQTIPIWFEANRTGQFDIACAQLCGLGHYRMKGNFVVESKEAFETWIQIQSADQNA